MARFKFSTRLLRLVVIAVLALNLSSCLNAEWIDTPTKQSFPFIINALPLDTKTQFGTPDGATYPVLWHESPAACFSLDGESLVQAVPTPSANSLSATFAPVFSTAPKAEGGVIYGFSPAGSEDPLTGGFNAINKSQSYANLCVPALQQPLANSVDPAAQPIYGAGEYTSADPSSEVNIHFSHALAYGKMKITNFAAGNISAVQIIFPVAVAGNSCKYYYNNNGAKLAGRVYDASENSIVLDAQNAEDATLWFSLVPTGVISSGTIVVRVKGSDDEIYQKTLTLSAAHSLAFNRGEISSFSVNMSGIKPEPWTLVTDASSLCAGDRIVIACNSTGKTAGTLASSILGAVESTFSADKTTITSLGSGSTIFTLGGVPGALTLSSSDQLLGATAVKKLAFGSGTTTWSISIDAENYNATVQNGTSSYGRFLYNVGSPRFTTYTSATSDKMLLPQLYKKGGLITVGGGSGVDPGDTGDDEEDDDDTPAPCGWLELPSFERGASQLYQTLYAGANRNYSYLYDTDFFCPLFTAYPLYSATMGGSRSGSWSYNPNIDTKYQINVRSNSYGTNYGASQYSRGHHIPDADRSGNETMQSQTYYVTNQSPQIQTKFNDGIWSSLEGAIRGLVSGTDTVYVVTGATFQKIGGSEHISYLTATGSCKPSSLPVPNYFWKVLLKVKRSGSTITSASTIGFWFENQAYSGSFTDHTISVDQIEAWTGFNFFANLPSALQDSTETNTNWTTFSNF